MKHCWLQGSAHDRDMFENLHCTMYQELWTISISVCIVHAEQVRRMIEIAP